MTIILASGNRHKRSEIAAVLDMVDIKLPQDVDVDFYYDETGTTFLENAFGKCEHLYNQVRVPVLADDSGLVVPALGGDPGVRSARYGSESEENNLDDADRNQYLLSNMRGIEDRKAYFVCCMVLIMELDRFVVAQETIHGEITLEPIGEGGFGYDPVFFAPSENKTVAQLPASRKNEISHRGRALMRIKRELTPLPD